VLLVCVVLQNNPNAFALSEHQKLEGAQALHMEETRAKMMMAIGQIPPLNEAGMLEHLHEFALEVGCCVVRPNRLLAGPNTFFALCASQLLVHRA